MKNLSIKAHLWIAFAVIPMIPVIFLSILQILQPYRHSWESIAFNLLITLVFTLFAGVFSSQTNQYHYQNACRVRPECNERRQGDCGGEFSPLCATGIYRHG